ncbi:hypothetical protein Dimus_024195 [Dionaea muscipula]
MSGGMNMQCLSCNKYYNPSGAYVFGLTSSASGACWAQDGPGTCKGCYVKARDTALELERENKQLKANVDFLRLCSPSSNDDPIQSHPRFSPLFSDVTLVASDDSADAPVPIPANKVVLASHSPVFKEMLETMSGTIKISDVTHDLLHVFVNYLYTADVCLDEKIASDLFVLAEKFKVKHLKEHCERYLASSLNWDNAVSNYVFAYKHNVGKLLEASLSIVTDDMDKFMSTDEYDRLVKKDPPLVVVIFEAYMKKQVKTAAKKGPS